LSYLERKHFVCELTHLGSGLLGCKGQIYEWHRNVVSMQENNVVYSYVRVFVRTNVMFYWIMCLCSNIMFVVEHVWNISM